MARRNPRSYAPSEEYISTPEELAVCVAQLQAADMMGFDTEFIGENSYRPELCLIQISTMDCLYLIDPFTCGSLDTFWNLFLNPGRTIIVHSGREDIRMCWHAIGNPPTRVIDVQIAAAMVGLTYPIGYTGLVQEILNARASKSETLTDWARRPLTTAQLKYAYDDVRHLIPAWDRIHTRLDFLNRIPWIESECASFVHWAIGGDEPIERWRKLKGIGRLSRKELAIIRAIYEWRETTAEKVDRPARNLMRDDIVIEVARSAARGTLNVNTLRGIQKSEMGNLNIAVQGALQIPASQYPEAEKQESDPPQVATLATLLSVVLADVCSRMELAPNLVATMSDLKELVRARLLGRPLPPKSQLGGGWRAEAVRQHLDDVLSGHTLVQVRNPNQASPLSYPNQAKPLPPQNPSKPDQAE